MSALMLHYLTGAALAFLVWIALRWSVRAGPRAMPALLLDLGILAAGWAAFLILTARPILAGLAILALGLGLITADRVKRLVLREPALFADRSELLEIVRHPQFFIPFAGTAQVIGALVAIAAAVFALWWIEPPALPWSLASPVLAVGVIVFFLVVPTWPPLLRLLCRLYESWGPSRDPAEDAGRFGLLATFVVHATLSRAERPARQHALRPAGVAPDLAAQTILLVQVESLFDVERLAPGLGAAVLPNWHGLRAAGAAHGRLAVPCWGANTIRSEFAVLSGAPPEALGLDRFNPYARLARTPIDSIAWQARQAGFTTVCVHPFDLGFYGRRRVLPRLGFDRLIGPEAFRGAARDGLYVSDAALFADVAALLGRETGRLFVFCITVAGHGPWTGGDVTALPPALAAGPEAAALARYLAALRRTDAALPVLREALLARPGPGVLGIYGDHQPSLPAAFAAAGFDGSDTDYLVWRPDAAPGAARDLPADRLGRKLLELAC